MGGGLWLCWRVGRHIRRALLEVVDLIVADDGVVDVVEVALEVLERVLHLGRKRRGEREESEREESEESPAAKA